MKARSRVLGAEHPDTLTILANLAHTWRSQQRDTDAITLMQHAVSLRIDTLGPGHPDTVTSLAFLHEWQSCQTTTNISNI
jgi:hypothetical protein